MEGVERLTITAHWARALRFTVIPHEPKASVGTYCASPLAGYNRHDTKCRHSLAPLAHAG